MKNSKLFNLASSTEEQLGDLTEALYNPEAITEETADKFLNGEYLTDPLNVALPH